MIFIRNSELKSDMHSTVEGCIRQTTQNPLPSFKLTLLMDLKEVTGTGVVKRGESVQIQTTEGDMPIYSFKMDRELMGLLKQEMGVWYE
jgi:hypothetical protein